METKTKTDAQWREELTPEQYEVLRNGATERAFTGALLGQPRGRHLPLRGLRRGAVLVRHEVRLRHRLAELHRAGGRRGGRAARGPRVGHEPHRGRVPQLRRPPRATCSTTARATPAACGTASTPARSTSASAESVASRVTSSRLIGRAAELAELEAALADAADGRPSLAFVAGESGVGKSRLLAELERRAGEQGALVLAGDCVDLGESELPYVPLVAALRPLARSGDPALTEPVRAAVAPLLPGARAGRAGRVGARSAPRRASSRACSRCSTRSASERPVLLLIEDLHWADRSTRAALAFLARSLVAERVLVVGSYRPDELHRRHPLRPLLAELERDPRARRVSLEPLTRDELAAQLEDILGAPPEADLLERLWTRSGGNPLYCEELLAAGLDGRGAAPDTLRDALMLRVEGLVEPAQEILRLVAVGQRARPPAAGRDERARRAHAARRAARGGRHPHPRRRRRRPLPLPPRAPARGRRGRPAARRARRAAPDAGARARAARRRARRRRADRRRRPSLRRRRRPAVRAHLVGPGRDGRRARLRPRRGARASRARARAVGPRPRRREARRRGPRVAAVAGGRGRHRARPSEQAAGDARGRARRDRRRAGRAPGGEAARGHRPRAAEPQPAEVEHRHARARARGARGVRGAERRGARQAARRPRARPHARRPLQRRGRRRAPRARRHGRGEHARGPRATSATRSASRWR